MVTPSQRAKRDLKAEHDYKVLSQDHLADECAQDRKNRMPRRFKSRARVAQQVTEEVEPRCRCSVELTLDQLDEAAELGEVRPAIQGVRRLRPGHATTEPDLFSIPKFPVE